MSDFMKDVFEKVNNGYWGVIVLRSDRSFTIPRGTEISEVDDLEVSSEFGSMHANPDVRWLRFVNDANTYYIRRDEIAVIRKYPEVTK